MNILKKCKKIIRLKQMKKKKKQLDGYFLTQNIDKKLHIEVQFQEIFKIILVELLLLKIKKLEMKIKNKEENL